MSTSNPPNLELRHAGEALRAKWAWFLAVGCVLILCGALAVALPVYSTFAASTVLGVALGICGVMKIIEALQVKEWGGCVWQLLVGAVEFVGGILIYLNPYKGALAISLLIASVFLIQGAIQIALALRVRPQPGWGWLFTAGIIAFCVTAAMLLKVRYTSFYTPGTLAGIALLVAGFAYVAIALSNRRSTRPVVTVSDAGA